MLPILDKKQQPKLVPHDEIRPSKNAIAVAEKRIGRSLRAQKA